MKLPIRNYLAVPVTLFIEPYCDEHVIPPGGEALVTLEDGREHSIDLHAENWVSLWDEGFGAPATVEVHADRPSLVPPKHKPVEKPE